MSFETLKCSHCGAIPKEPARFCGFCGSMLPTRAPVVAAPIESPERFDAVQAHPDLQALLDRRPEDPGASSVVPGVIVVVVSAAIAVGVLSQVAEGSIPPWFLVAPALLALLGFGLLLAAKLERGSPIHRNVAVVLDERVRVSGGGGNSHAETHYYILIADRSGQRVELEAEEDLAGRTAPGDIGVAYIRRGRLVDFSVVRT